MKITVFARLMSICFNCWLFLAISVFASDYSSQTRAGGAAMGPGIISINPKAFAPIFPVGNKSSVTAGFFDSTYAQSQKTQHLGVDIGAPEGSTVVSPVYGRVIKTNIVSDAWNSHIVIEDFNTGWQHVIGHIDSEISVGTTVAAGEPIGTVVTAGTGPHVHWGMNKNLNTALSGEWGWGRAPDTATEDQAISKGWVDPMDMI